MSGRSKGFDPLSNLFDAPVPSAAVQPEEDPTAKVEVDKAALAKKLAAEARARIEAEAPAPVDKVALAKKLAAEAKARAAEVATEPQDKAALAKALAKAAMAKNAAAKPAASKPAAPKKRSLADRANARRPMSALDAARAAAAQEAARKQETAAAERVALQQLEADTARKAVSTSGGVVEKLFGDTLTVQPARIAAQRQILQALWKAHMKRHADACNWTVAGSCAAIADALARLGAGQLAVIPAAAGDADLLIWVDLSRSAVVAVVPSEPAYLAGL